MNYVESESQYRDFYMGADTRILTFEAGGLRADVTCAGPCALTPPTGS